MRDKVILENGGTLRFVQTTEKIKNCVIKLLIKMLLLQNLSPIATRLKNM